MNFHLFSTPKPTLQTARVVLMEPFVRHAAGYVFELSTATSPSGWGDDDRVRERQSFIGKSAYFLPDGGNGYSAELLVNMTKPCPPAVFEGIDLRSGPCRVTGSRFGTSPNEAAAAASSLKHQVRLVEINGLNAQGIEVALEHRPSKIALHDLLRNSLLRKIPISGHHLAVDFSDLLPGFYQVVITGSGGTFHFIRVFKAFPLVVTSLDGAGRFSAQKTLY